MKSILITAGTGANRAVRNTIGKQWEQKFDFVLTESEEGELVLEKLPEEYLEQWRKEPVTIILLVALGGKTGALISLRIVEQLNAYNLSYYLLATLPFVYEGSSKILNALQTLNAIKQKISQGLIFIQNNENVRLFECLSIDESFRKSDQAIMINMIKIILFKDWLGDIKNELEDDLKELICNAENGDVHAQIKLGKIYCCNQDFEKAIAWFEKAAEQGNDDAQLGLGLCYEFGYESGIKSDIKQANEWYKKSAAQKNELAQKYLDLLDLTCVVK